MVDTTLQLGHLSSLFLLLCLHILALAKELVFQGLIHWVAGHGDRTRRSGGVKESTFFSQESRTLFVVIPSSFMEEEVDPLSMESR